MPGRPSVPPEKIARVAALQQMLLGHPLTALVGIRGVPAAALQNMRQNLLQRGHPLVVAPNSAIRHALEQAAKQRPALRPLLEYVTDQTGLIVADGNPFSLYQELVQTRSATPARGGAIAPNDIVVPGGETAFKPGPIVAELQHAGFPAVIEKGKVVLKRDATIAKAGDVISAEKANLLTRLGIFPLEVGLDLRAAVERETFYAPSVLAVDLTHQRAELVRAYRRALALAVEVGYLTRETLPILLTRAYRGAIAVAVESAYPTAKSLPEILARAFREAKALQALTGTPAS
ncbi:MAG: 50S ribosomal protein L10 [Thermoplasmata archaeon]|nr:50S ribosomal protein L10 [Thermoplasmata archaeon]